MADISTYSPEAVIFTLGGSTLTGWNSISINRDADQFTVIKGIRGKHTRSRNYDNSATIVLDLPMSSEWNYILSQIVTQDTASGTGRCEILIKDNSGRSLFKTTQAYVRKFADVTFDMTISSRIWTIQCLDVDVYTVGGSTSPAASLLNNVYSSISNIFS